MEQRLQKEIDEAQKQLTDLRVQQRATADSINQMTLEKEEVEKQLENTRNALLDAQFDLTEEYKKLEDIKTFVGKLKVDSDKVSDELNNKNARHGEAIILLEEQIRSLSSAASALESSHKELDSLLATKNRQLLAVEEQIVEKRKSFEAEKALCETTINSLKQTISVLTQELTEKQSLLGEVVLDIASKKEIFDNIQSTAESKLKELHVVENKVASTNSLIKELEDVAVLKKTSIDLLEKNLVSLKEESEAFKKEKFNVLEQKRALDQRETRLRKLYEDAGVVYPE